MKAQLSPLRFAPKVVALLITAAISLGVAGVASATCDVRRGSQFSNSSPLINITANNSNHFPLQITVGGVISWGVSGSSVDVGGGYYKQAYTTGANEYTVGTNPYIDFNFPSTAGSCASFVYHQTILVAS